jgi:integrase
VSGAELRALQPARKQASSTQPEWSVWLRGRLDPDWRPGEWDDKILLFTGDLANDRTAAWGCRTPGCLTATRRQHGRCDACRRARSGLGVSWEDFDAAPPERATRPVTPTGTCGVAGCGSEPLCRGLCHRHERLWRRNDTQTVEEFAARARPFPRRADCVVAGCVREAAGRRGLCRFHNNRLHRAHTGFELTPEVFTGWVAAERPRLAVGQFSLAGLPEPLATEVLYGLQQRDSSPPPLDPTEVRILLERLDGAQSLRTADPQAVCESGGSVYNNSTRGLFRDLRRHLDRAWAAYAGVDPFAGEVWQVALLDLQHNASRPWPCTRGVVDFTVIEVDWLRAVLKDWAKTARPYLQRLRETLRAARVASRALAAAGRVDPTRLDAGDFARIADAIGNERRDDGRLYSASHRRLLLHQFRIVCEHGRSAGLMTTVPDPFRPAGRRHWVRDEEPNEDEIGKALPESVIAQLDANLDLLGPAGRAGVFTAIDLQAMHQAIYQILRDTGRRPGEVVSLAVDCVEVIDGQHNLVYDNHKAARRGRRLPITAATAGIIADWRAHRLGLRTAPVTDRWLFPSPLLRSQQSAGHLTSNAVCRGFKAWADKIEVIDSELLGADGTPEPFDTSQVRPYSLRHAYAQRHADAGVPVDVLKELMDHVSVTTTMGYYRISNKRKQQAISAVGALAANAAGDPAPFTSPTAYQRASVSVPYGNCTEPSNVTAGGGACPIRFQCAGCGFYRPDPSYLPALEQHIADLRQDRETARAMGAAEYVIVNLTGEIDAYAAVCDRMRSRLAELPEDHRAEVEDASKLLRKARAGRQLPVVAVTTGSQPA